MIAALVAASALSWLVYMPSSAERGVWRAQTGGTIITLTPFTAQMYSETAVSCLHQLSFPAHLKLVELTEGATVEVIDTNLHLRVDGSVEPTVFERITALPDNCTTPDAATAAPRAVFDTMWHAMSDHYAFFELHGVDWNARRAFAPAPDAQMSDSELFDLLSATLAGLDDGHVQLGTPIGFFSPHQAPPWLPEGGELDRDSLSQIARDTIGAELTRIDLTGLEYALLADGVGYVMIRHMGLDTPFGSDSQTAMALAFSEIADAFEAADTIIIDIRYNPGGSDTVALGVASHFAGAPVDVFTKTTRNGNGETAAFTAAVLPYDSTPLDQPVIVLTSGLTGSAAEILTMALREMPNITTMGGPTSGGLSDILGFKLPNGWDLGLSHQTYRTMDGESFEGIGIPPDVHFEIETAPLLQGEDPLLRAAFARARGN